MKPEKFCETLQGYLAVIACCVAKDAGDYIREQRNQHQLSDLGVSTKASPTDMVTLVDKESETLIRQLIARLRPQDKMLGEETGECEIASEKENRQDGIKVFLGNEEKHCQTIEYLNYLYRNQVPKQIKDFLEHTTCRWIVDPIDGTANFVYNIPSYSVSIACEVEGVVIAGAVADVTRERVYVAARHCGAYRIDNPSFESKQNESDQCQLGQRLTCSQTDSLKLALVSNGFSCILSRREQQAKIAAQLIPQIRDLRRFGSAALDMCFVAEGIIDAHFEYGISGWDFAAGALIAKEAGASVTIPSVDTPSSEGEIVFVSTPKISDQLRSFLQKINSFCPIP